jgi:hypothetical protein
MAKNQHDRQLILDLANKYNELSTKELSLISTLYSNVYQLNIEQVLSNNDDNVARYFTDFKDWYQGNINEFLNEYSLIRVPHQSGEIILPKHYANFVYTNEPFTTTSQICLRHGIQFASISTLERHFFGCAELTNAEFDEFEKNNSDYTQLMSRIMQVISHTSDEIDTLQKCVQACQEESFLLQDVSYMWEYYIERKQEEDEY